MRSVLPALAAALLLGGCATVHQILDQRPQARVAGVTFPHLGLQEVTLAFEVEITNPYPVNLPLLDVDYTLHSGQRVVVEGETDLDGVVPAGDRRVVSLPVTVVPADLLATLSGLRPGAVVPYRAEIGLSVDPPGTDRIRLPLSHEGELPLPAPPTVRLRSIAWDRIGLEEVRGTARLEVGNPNAFGLELARLGAALSLAGTEVADLGAADGPAWEPGGTETLALPLGFSPTRLGAAALSLLRGEEAAYGLRGGMTVQTPFGPLDLPLDADGTTAFTR